MQLEAQRYTIFALVSHKTFLYLAQLWRWILNARDRYTCQSPGSLTLRCFDLFANCGLSESTALWFVGPGKSGPVPTGRTRMLQEGLQEAEVRIFVQNAILDDDKKAKLG